MIIQGLRFLSPGEAQEALREGALLVDLRSEDLTAMKRFRVPETLHLAHRDLLARVPELPRGRLLVLADTSGVFLRPAASVLAAHGFTYLVCLNGGMLAWDQQGYPVDTDPEALLQGECACMMKSVKAKNEVRAALPLRRQ
jgi:rhodanese-related sulfurtransferase